MVTNIKEGEAVGVFTFSSAHMENNLKGLKTPGILPWYPLHALVIPYKLI